MQPPEEKRMKPGCKSTGVCTISARKPPGRFFHVCSGKSETKSTSSVPLPISVTDNRAAASVSLGCSVAVYFCQLPVKSLQVDKTQ